jgi:DNA-binding transcriptional LysR family regulator
MDRFDALRVFARVVEASSFTKAAQTLHMSKTTVTQLVQQLEARLRVKLLSRTTRACRPAIPSAGAGRHPSPYRRLPAFEPAPG